MVDVLAVGAQGGGPPHGVLVHGGVWLGGGVVRRREAVTGLTAVVAVAVVHCAVWVLVCRKHARVFRGRLGGLSQGGFTVVGFINIYI